MSTEFAWVEEFNWTNFEGTLRTTYNILKIRLCYNDPYEQYTKSGLPDRTWFEMIFMDPMLRCNHQKTV